MPETVYTLDYYNGNHMRALVSLRMMLKCGNGMVAPGLRLAAMVSMLAGTRYTNQLRA